MHAYPYSLPGSRAQRSFAALRRYGFATLISTGDEGRPYASRLATILRRDGDGRVRLWTHIDRRNPQLETLDRDREVLLVAYGPDSYISPAWYLRHSSVPSWNCVAVHVRGLVRLFPDDRPELNDWLHVPDRFHKGLALGVQGFEIEIAAIAAAFKLSQDKDRAGQAQRRRRPPRTGRHRGAGDRAPDGARTRQRSLR